VWPGGYMPGCRCSGVQYTTVRQVCVAQRADRGVDRGPGHEEISPIGGN
jgi:hypothetical protein